MYSMIVADDELWIRERIITSIDWKKIGITAIGEAADGEEALALCRELKPDIILTDIRMPGINGLDFIKTLYEEKIVTKVVIISGYSDFSYAQKAIKLGVVDYILKPVENAELVTIVKKCMRQIEAETFRNSLLEQADSRKKMTEKLTDYVNTPGGSRKRNTIEKAIDFINKNYSRPITLIDVSEDVMLNPSYFSKLFKESMGTSFNRYLTQFRLNKAKELMSDPTFRIKEIADLVGYDDVRYFIKVFKSYTGLSPNIYKEQI